MLPLRHAKRWRVASFIILLLVLASALMPAVWFWDHRPHAFSWFDGVDKWLHGITFLVLSLWFSGMYQSRSYWRIGIGLILFGLMIEACQRAVGYRTAEWFDVGADAAGIIIGLSFAAMGVGGWCLRVEERLASR
jgi:hypothetical protein